MQTWEQAFSLMWNKKMKKAFSAVSLLKCLWKQLLGPSAWGSLKTSLRQKGCDHWAFWKATLNPSPG